MFIDVNLLPKKRTEKHGISRWHHHCVCRNDRCRYGFLFIRAKSKQTNRIVNARAKANARA